MSLTIDGRTADERLNFASENHIPPYAWVPPEWAPGKDPPLSPTNNQRPFVEPPAAPNELGCPMPDENKPGRFKGDFEALPGEDQLDPNDPSAKLKKFPQPFSDFSHVDPTTGSTAAFNNLKKRVERTAGEADVQILDRLAGPNSAPMQRLEKAFQLIQCKVNALLTQINEAIKANDAKAYNLAREEYIRFLRNLDNHEPQTGPRQISRGIKDDGPSVEPARAFGYGKVIKWAYIEPIIEPRSFERDGKPYNANFIIGMTVIIQWNPHSSSNGVPIPHPPPPP